MTTCIAFLCGTTGWGGLEMNHLKNALWFHQKGIKVHVFAVYDSPFYREAEKLNLPLSGIQKHKNHYDFFRAFQLYKLIKQTNISHIFIRATFDMSIAASCKFLSGNKIRLCFFMEMQLTTNKKQLFRTLRYSFIDYWFCPLEYLVEQVKTRTKIAHKKIHLLFSGVPLKQFDRQISRLEARKLLNLPEDVFLFGLIGRFDQYKGHFLVVNAVQLAKNNSFHVVFMGAETPNVKSDYLLRLKDEIDYLNLEKRFHFLPHNQNVSPFYRAINCCLMTSEAETMGMVTLEAFAHGTPVLGSNRGGTTELIQKSGGGILFESMNDFDLAHKMDEIYEQQHHFESVKMLYFTEQFNMDNIGKKLISLLNLA